MTHRYNIISQANDKFYLPQEKMVFMSMMPLSELGVTTTIRNAGFGLTQAEADTLYQNTLLENKVTIYKMGWQKIIIPETKEYLLEVQGADGGSGLLDADNNTGLVKGGRGAILKAYTTLNANDVIYVLVGNHGWCTSSTSGGWGACGGGASLILKANPDGAYTLIGDIKVDLLLIAGGGAGRSRSNRDKINDISVDSCPLNAIIDNGANTDDGLTFSAKGGSGLLNILNEKNATNSAAYKEYPYTWGGGGQAYNGGGGGGGYSGGLAVDSYPSYGGTSFINSDLCRVLVRKLRPYKEEPSQNGIVKIY